MTIPILRPFQADLKYDVHQAWNQGAKNVLMRLDTGGGKTVVLADINREHAGYTRIIAHRQELIGQLSLTIAKYGVRHNIIASAAVKRSITRAHVEELGYSLYDPAAKVAVISVDTGVRYEDPQAPFVTLWTVDEGHHLVDGNKWHKLISRYTHPDCRGLLPTATPVRADGKGLGRHADGVADVMVQGPAMRWLIDQGYLTDYRIICPPSDMQVLSQAGASGDWSSKQLREAAQRSHIVGDVVANYLRWAPGKLGITFSTDVETAHEITAAYKAAGVRAEALTGKTDDYVRRTILKRFSNRDLDQIVAVDIISEGFDLPAIEVASMARPTQSLALYMQQFGRTLRPMPGKDRALIIDHAANVVRHFGPPDRPRPWTLDRRGSRQTKDSDAIPIRVCTNCFTPYERIFRECPHCGHYEEPAGRSAPGMVDGDLMELSPEILAQLRENVAAMDMSIPLKRAELHDKHMPHIGIMANVKRHAQHQEAQALLRPEMALWGGARKAEGMTDSQMQRLFFHRFGVDVWTAQTLETDAALKLFAQLVK